MKNHSCKPVCYYVADYQWCPPFLHTYRKHKEHVTIRTRPPSCWKNFVEFAWWHVSKCVCLHHGPQKQACWLKSPAMCFSSPHLCLCLEMNASETRKPSLAPLCFWSFLQLTRISTLLAGSSSLWSFWFYYRQTERRRLPVLPEVL